MGHAALNHIRAHAIGNADIARHGKGGTGHQNQIVRFCPGNKILLVIFRRLHKQIEGSLRLDAFKAKLRQAAPKQLPIVIIECNVAFLLQAASRSLLQKAWCIDKAVTAFAISRHCSISGETIR